MKTFLKSTTSLLIIFVIGITLLIYSCETANDLLPGSLDELEGYWDCEETSEIIGFTSYEVYISPDPDNPNGIIIDDFYHVGIAVEASVIAGSVSISNYTEAGFTVNGSGTVSNNDQEIILSYTVSDSEGEPDHCSAIFTKQ